MSEMDITLSLCPFVAQKCSNQEYVDKCLKCLNEDIKFQIQNYQQDEIKAQEVAKHNWGILASYCSRRLNE